MSVSTDAHVRRGIGDRSDSISLEAALARIMEVLRPSEVDPFLVGVSTAPVKESDLSPTMEWVLWHLPSGLGVDRSARSLWEDEGVSTV